MISVCEWKQIERCRLRHHRRRRTRFIISHNKSKRTFHVVDVFGFIMACVLCVTSSTLTALTSLLPRSYRQSLQPLATIAAHSILPCGFSTLHRTHTKAATPTFFAHLLAASSNEEPLQRQSQPSKLQRNENRRYSSTSQAPLKLERPEVIFTNNHLLVVNKVISSPLSRS
jgi:hypothetical protein